MKVEFAPGCFDSFEGTQEELDGLVAEITKMFETGEIPEGAEVIRLDDDLPEDLTLEEAVQLLGDLTEEDRQIALEQIDSALSRTLH